MQLDNMKITASVSDGRRRRPHAARHSYGKRGRAKTYAGSMLIKIGFCLAVLAAAVLVQKFLLQEEGRAVVEASTEDGERTESESEDVLGRLRFVDAGGVKSVFAASQRWSMPVNSRETELMEEETLLKIKSHAGESVSVAAAGEVLAIARDEAWGDYIRIHHGSDLESIYYNIDNIRAEVGQPLIAKDSLGTVGDSGMLYVKIMQSGVPQLPTAYLYVPD